MKYVLMMLACYVGLHTLHASDITVSAVRVINRGDVPKSPLSVIFDLKWSNAWHNSKNHDAAWIIMKYGGYWNNHVRIRTSGHRILQDRSGANPALEVVDGLGLFVKPTLPYRGDVDIKLQILLDTTGQQVGRARLTDLSVHAIEMVYIPEGAFTLGSPDTAAITRASFYRSDDAGGRSGLYRVTSEGQIEVGPREGNLYYWSERDLYNGDRLGPVPAGFPKGFAAFYTMKYELTQGQYADFLNTLSKQWTFDRSPIGGRDYHADRGGIYYEGGKYVAQSRARPMNFISFTDGLAYTDWACLRPLTELEYTKAARGPEIPEGAEFVWGTDNYDQLERYVDADGEVRWHNDIYEDQLHDENRPVLGASYYWVMDLSGSLWEKVITIGNPVGRAFTGTHGDGRLRFGHATNDDWPKSDNEVGGFGYRGGGYYEVGTLYSDFNPHSPTGYRYYGSWSGGPRSIAYGFRAGRSAP